MRDDEEGKLISVIDLTVQTLSYVYSGDGSRMTGQPTSVTDATGTVPNSAYDNCGPIIKNSIADTVTLEYIYSNLVYMRLL